MEVVLAVLVAITMAATGGITKVTTRVEVEAAVGDMEEMVMTAMVMVSVLIPHNHIIGTQYLLLTNLQIIPS